MKNSILCCIFNHNENADASAWADRIRVVHPGGTGYNKQLALKQMRAWHATIPGYTSPRHFRPLREPVKM